MMKLNIFSKTVLILTLLKGIFVVSFILSLILWSVPILSFNSNIWKIFQERSSVLFDQSVKNYNDQIIEFFRKDLKLEFLNEKEFGHMKDVKQVITMVNILFVFSFVGLITGISYFSRSQKRFLLETVRKTSIVVFITVLILSIIILTNFYSSFIAFHKIFFVRNFIFPADSLLKTLYPNEFFFGLSALYLLSVLLISLVVMIVSHKLKLK